MTGTLALLVARRSQIPMGLLLEPQKCSVVVLIPSAHDPAFSQPSVYDPSDTPFLCGCAVVEDPVSLQDFVLTCGLFGGHLLF